MKTPIDLGTFQRFVLPTLRKQFIGDALQQHVSSTFDITENGVPIDVRFTGHADHGDITSSITKAVDAIARQPVQHKAIRAIDGGFSGGSFGFKTHGATTQFFKGEGAKEKAMRWGAWALACFAGSEKAMAFCQENGIEIKSGQNEGTNTVGGYLVPSILADDIIDLRLEYGVARRNSRVRTMTSDTLRVSRRTGGMTATFVGEGAAGSVSTKGWDQIQLIAKKVMAVGKISSEVLEDAIINLGDDLAGEIAYAFSYLEDQCAFIGDGTSTYGGIFGICPKLVDINGVDDAGGIIVAAGNAFSEFILSDFNRTVARLPSYARKGAKWFASPTFCDAVMQKLITAAGGTRTDDITEGARPSFLGYPVERTEVMPIADVNSQIACLFGNMAQATSFGDRRQVTIDLSKSGVVSGGTDVFLTDELLIRGTQRFDFIAHDLGTATVAGAMVGLMSAAS